MSAHDARSDMASRTFNALKTVINNCRFKIKTNDLERLL